MLTLLVIGLLVVFISGAPLFSIMLAGTALGSLYSVVGFESGFLGAIIKIFGTGTSEHAQVLSTIPLFIYAGYLLAESGTADRLVRFANAVLGWVPGGLAIVTIMTCSLFTVFTGASGVTIIALGGVLMPALVKNGYPDRFSMGLIAGTGSVGLLFPPALPLFIYGTVYGLTNLDPEIWDTRRFLFAGIVPGMVLVGMLSLVAIAVAVYKKLPRQAFSFGELVRSFFLAIPELGIPFGVIALLASGFGLADVAALTVVYVVILEMGIFRLLGKLSPKARGAGITGLPLKAAWAISYEAMAMIGALFAIILTATAFTDFIIDAEVPKKLVAFTQAHVESKVLFLLAVNVILLFVGMIMDIFSAIVVVLPLIAPIAKAYGIDPYHLGVIFLLNLEIGYLTPPVGLNLFLTSLKFQRPVVEVMWATLPFLISMIVTLMVISYIPSLTVVPPAERTQPVTELQNIVRDGLVEVGVTVREVTLVDSAGKPLVGPGGKPVVRTFGACRKEVADNEKREADAAVKIGKDKPKVDLNKRKAALEQCQSLFVKASDCKKDTTKSPEEQTACYNAAVAGWTADVYQEVRPIEEAIISVKSIKFVDADGKPLSFEQNQLDAAGREILDEDFQPKKIVKPIVDKGGQPITRDLAWCDQLDSSFDVDNCKRLFISASNCAIQWETPEDCLDEACPEDGDGDGDGDGDASEGKDDDASEKPEEAKPADAGSAAAGSADAGSAAGAPAPPANDRETCKRTALVECRKTQTAACVLEKTKSWINENELIALDPKLKGGAKAQAASGATGGPKCSTNNASSFGFLIVGATVIALRRRRRRIAA